MNSLGKPLLNGLCIRWWKQRLIRSNFLKKCSNQTLLQNHMKLKNLVVGYVKKKFKMEENEKSPVAETHCHLTDKFRGLAQRKWNLRKRKEHASSVPIFRHNFFG